MCFTVEMQKIDKKKNRCRAENERKKEVINEVRVVEFWKRPETRTGGKIQGLDSKVQVLFSVRLVWGNQIKEIK